MSGTLTRRVCPSALAGRLFFLCALTYIIALFGRLSYSSVMAELIASEGLSKSQAGLIGTALCGVYGVFQVFSGMIGDRISPKKLIFTGVMGSAILNLIMGMTGSYSIMLVVWAVNGVFQSFVWSPVARIFAEMMPPERRKKSCSDAAITYPLATVLVYLLASVMLATLGWRSVFLISAVMMIAVSVYWLFRMTWFERQTRENGEIETIELNEQEQKNGDSMLRLMVVSGVIFAVVGEDLGFSGCMGILILFMAFLFFGLRIAIRCEDRFGSLLAGGITCMIGVQCVLNVAVVTGLMPTTGLPLPFFSAGGTSISIVMCAVAVLMNISASARRE